MDKTFSSHETLKNGKKKEPINQKMSNMKERLLSSNKLCDSQEKQEDNLKTKEKEDNSHLKQLDQLKTQIEELEKDSPIKRNLSKSSTNTKILNAQFAPINRKQNTIQPNKMFLNQSYTFLNYATNEEDKFKQIQQKAKILKEKQKKQRGYLKKIVTKNMSNRQQLNRSKSSIFASENNNNQIIGGKGYDRQLRQKHQRMQSQINGKRQIPRQKEWSFMVQAKQEYLFGQQQLEYIFGDMKKQSQNQKQYQQIIVNDISCFPATICTEQNNFKVLKQQKQYLIQVKHLKTQNEQLKKQNRQLQLQKQEYLQIILKYNEEKNDWLNQLKSYKKQKEQLRAQNQRIEQVLKKINLENIETQKKAMQERIQTYSKSNNQLNDRLIKLQLRYNFLKQDFTEKILQLNQAAILMSQLKNQYNCQLFQLKQQLNCYKKKNIKLQTLIRKKQNNHLDPLASSYDLDHKITILQQQIITKGQDRKNINNLQETQCNKYLQINNLKTSNSITASTSNITTATNQQYNKQKKKGSRIVQNLQKNT